MTSVCRCFVALYFDIRARTFRNVLPCADVIVTRAGKFRGIVL